MKKISKIIVSFLVLINTNLFSQPREELNILPNVITPSPDISSLGKFVDMPISLYNGIPNVSIPIWEIKGKSISVPISLNYHAGGIKVEEIASRVGLGWALNAGGVISRTVNGLPDDVYYGFTNITINPPTSATFEEYRNYADGIWDCQMDQFFFNFVNHSGKFYLGTDAKGYLMDEQDIKFDLIEYNPEHNRIIRFRMIDENGTKYTFDALELSQLFDVEDPSFEKSLSPFHVTTWYLTKIESVSYDEKILFVYNSSDIVTRNEIQRTYTNIYNYDGVGGSSNNHPHKKEMEIYHKRISEIQYYFDGKIVQKIEFKHLKDRFDFIQTKSLDQIIIKDKNDTLVRQFDLNYQYGIGGSFVDIDHYSLPDKDMDDIRLYLKSITEHEGNLLEMKPPYVFDYYSGLPNRLSFDQDFWGYYNNAGNSSLIPQIKVLLESSHEMVTIGEANRLPVYDHAKSGSLYKITYPTGAVTKFEYESNDCFDCVEYAFDQIYDPNQVVRDTSFVITANPTCTSEDLPHCIQPNSVIEFTTGNIVPASNVKLSLLQLDNLPDGQNNLVLNATNFWQIRDLQDNIVFETPTTNVDLNHIYEVTLQGETTYKLGCFEVLNCEAPCPTPIYPSMINIEWSEYPINYVPQPNVQETNYLGGLRIKKLLQTDPLTGKNMIKIYEYKEDDGKSSGKTHGLPKYTYDVDYFIWTTDDNIYVNPLNLFSSDPVIGGDGNQIVHLKSHIGLTSFSQHPLGLTKGYSTGYRKVTVFYGQDSTDNQNIGIYGKKDAIFNTHIVNLNDSDYPYAPLEYYVTSDGDLKEEIYYKRAESVYVPVKKTEYLYLPVINVNADKLKHYKVAPQVTGWESDDWVDPQEPPNWLNSLFIKWLIPQYGWKKLDHIIDTYYSDYGFHRVENHFNYNYKNYKINEKLTYDSKSNRSYKQIYKYTVDYDPVSNPDISSLLDDHITGKVVESQLWLVENSIDKLISGNINEYKIDNNFYKLKSFYQIETDKPINKINFNELVNGEGLYEKVNPDTRYYKLGVEYFYNQNGTVQEIIDHRKGINNVYIFEGFDIVANILNAPISQVAYSGFETEYKGGWDYINSFAAYGYTGNRSFNGGSIMKSNLPPGQYKLSGWIKNGTISFSNSGLSISSGNEGQVIDGWQFVEKFLDVNQSTNSLTINNSGVIDDLKVHPINAEMITYTYKPLVGLQNTIGTNNLKQSFEYDQLGRLKSWRDHNNNFIQHHSYKYFK